MNTAFFEEQGWDCFFAGGSDSDNPYAESDVRHYHWHNGFVAAQFNSTL